MQEVAWGLAAWKQVGEIRKSSLPLIGLISELAVDTGRPIYQSQVIGAALPVNGYLAAYHVTDNPEGIIRYLQSGRDLVALNPYGDLGGGFYVSSVPEYWRSRSKRKWEFARNLSKAQRQTLVKIILEDPRYKRGGGYLTDFEVERLYKDLDTFVESGDLTFLIITANQPYNVRITPEMARRAGVPEPREPGLVEVKLRGKFIDGEGFYGSPSYKDFASMAKTWVSINKPKLLKNDIRNTINAWLESLGYSGIYTRTSMSTNPEMVVWDKKAITSFRVVQE